MKNKNFIIYDINRTNQQTYTSQSQIKADM